MKNNKIKILVCSCLILCAYGCNAWEEHIRPIDENVDIQAYEVIQSIPELSIYTQLLQKYGYDVLLSDLGSCTVFAPNNEAWQQIDVENEELVRSIISGMITSAKFRATDSLYTGKVLALNGKAVSFDAARKTYDRASIVKADIVAMNAYIHVVDKVVFRKDNIYEALQSRISQYKQVEKLFSLNTQVVDLDKSVPAGIDENGQIFYDPMVMKTYNPIIDQYPLNDEQRLYTYILVENTAFEQMYVKYQPYFKCVDKIPEKGLVANAHKTDSMVYLNLCGDYAIDGLQEDLSGTFLTNAAGVKIPIDASRLKESIECSNGIIYVFEESNISMRSKIKPIRIEGENYKTCMDKNYLQTRYRTWASGTYDVMLVGKSKYQNFPTDPTTSTNSNFYFNGTNYYIEYSAPNVYSTNYYIEYVAYDDYDAHDGLELEQKLFISMPEMPKLYKKNITDSVNCNYLGSTCCFVGKSWAASPNVERSRLCKWTLQDTNTQLLSAEVKAPDAEVMTVPNYGELTMWLCNTTRYSDQWAGFLFLDYIELVPIITE